MKELNEIEKSEDQLACFDGSEKNTRSDNFSSFILAVPEHRVIRSTHSLLI
jgi:hypothetical protein